MSCWKLPYNTRWSRLGGRHEALWDAITTRSPTREEWASTLKQSIQKKVSRNKCKRLLNPQRMYKSESGQNGKPVATAGNFSPCAIQRVGWRVSGRLSRGRNCARRLFDQSPFYGLWLCPVAAFWPLLFFKNVACLIIKNVSIGVTARTLEHNAFEHIFKRVCPIARSWQMHSREDPSRRDYRQEVWSNQEKGASSHVWNHTSTRSFCFSGLFLPEMRPACGRRQPEVPVTFRKQSCLHWQGMEAVRVSPPNETITFIHGTSWTYVSLCKPFYTFCTFVLLLSIKIGLL